MLNPIERQRQEPSTRPDAATTEPAPGTTARSGLRNDSERLRRWTAIGALIAFAINLVLAQVTINDARGGDVSAVQIIQIWTPHIYYAVLITGVAVALYIYSRGQEHPR